MEPWTILFCSLCPSSGPLTAARPSPKLSCLLLLSEIEWEVPHFL